MARTRAQMMGNDQGEPMKDCGSDDNNTGRGQGERRQKNDSPGDERSPRQRSQFNQNPVKLVQRNPCSDHAARAQVTSVVLDASLGKREPLASVLVFIVFLPVPTRAGVKPPTHKACCNSDISLMNDSDISNYCSYNTS